MIRRRVPTKGDTHDQVPNELSNAAHRLVQTFSFVVSTATWLVVGTLAHGTNELDAALYSGFLIGAIGGSTFFLTHIIEVTMLAGIVGWYYKRAMETANKKVTVAEGKVAAAEKEVEMLRERIRELENGGTDKEHVN